MDRYHEQVHFVFVYIQEAHASDEWPINNLPLGADGSPVVVNQHICLEERYRAAELLRSTQTFHPSIHFLVDSMNNEFNAAFASWPFRVWALEQGKIAYAAQPDELSLEYESLTDAVGIIGVTDATDEERGYDRYGIDMSKLEFWLQRFD